MKKKTYELILTKTSNGYIPVYLLNLFLKREKLTLYHQDNSFFKKDNFTKQKHKLKFRLNKKDSIEFNFKKSKGYTIGSKYLDKSETFFIINEIESMDIIRVSKKEIEILICFASVSDRLKLYLVYDRG